MNQKRELEATFADGESKRQRVQPAEKFYSDDELSAYAPAHVPLRDITGDDEKTQESDQPETASTTEAHDQEEEFVPFSTEEADEMKQEARQMGSLAFIQEHLNKGTPIKRLMYAFDFEIPAILWDSPDSVLWNIFSKMLRRFCLIRFKLPHYNTIDDAVQLIQSAKNILVLTGAGISVSCGIPDFRSENGLYKIIGEKYPDLDEPQLMFDIHYFRHNPHPFFDLAKEIFPSNFKPSPTHQFIRLLQDKGKLLRNYTQNIDTIEKMAGIQRVVHCHGSFDTATCQRCKYQVDGNAIKDAIFSTRIPYCPKCGDVADDVDDDERPGQELPAPILKPDIVFFGEKLPDEFDRLIVQDRHEVDLMIVMGSSLKVAPVSDLIGFMPHHVPLIMINREPVYHFHHSIDINLLGYCDEIIRVLCQKLEWEIPNAEAPEDVRSISEPTHIEPNVHLFQGAVFDELRHARHLANEASSSEDEGVSSSDLERGSSEDEITESETEGVARLALPQHIVTPFDLNQEFPSTDEEDEEFGA